jgi:F-type H+-transporting ATPase subunit a
MGVAGVVPLVAVIAVTGIELIIAFLQAFVFTILTCIYLNDALHMH